MALKVRVFRLSHPLKAPLSMIATFSGMVRLVSPRQLPKAQLPIDVTLSGMATSVSSVQPNRNPAGRWVTLGPMETEVNLVQPKYPAFMDALLHSIALNRRVFRLSHP